MAKANRTEVFDAPIENVYAVLLDYESYPDFMTGVDKVTTLESSETSAKVEYEINVIKKLRYTLNLKQTKPTEISWSFNSGDLFKVNEGAWKLKDLGDGKTEVEYSVDIDIKGFIPGSGKIAEKLTETQLPGLMKSVCDRAKAL